jgi:tetratricopeptide (TPR) repeat protein
VFRSYTMSGRAGKSISGWMGMRLQWAVVGGVLTLMPVAVGAQDAGDIASAVTQMEPSEDSVLVASRKGEPTPADPQPDDEEQLDPISFDSENEPEPADPQESLEPEGAARQQVIRVASTQNDCADQDQTTVSEPQLAMFHGIQPGVSTKSQLTKAWGVPKEVTPVEGGELLAYDIESFKGVRVLLENGVVTLMKIQLGKPETPAALAAKVKASPNESARVYDDTTRNEVGVIYPERGIVFVFDPSDEVRPDSEPQVSLMLLQPLDPQAFCMRGEQRREWDLTGRLDDFTEAVEVSPADGEANWMLAGLQLQLGRATEAAASAKRATDAEPENPAYRLRWADCLKATGQYDAAVLETRKVIDTEGVPPLVQAQAYHRLGLLASLGDAEIADTAIEFHNKALAAADKIANSNDPYVRREAKQVLVDAHLAIAIEVSRREFSDKPTSVADWVSRASGFAEEMIASGDAGLEVRLHVAEESLAALANFKPAKDPQPLVDEIEQTLEELLENGEEIDPLWREQLYWKTGLAYLSAVQINHQRGETEAALEFADRAVEYLADAAEQRRDSPATQQLIGRLYFHIGAVHAVHNKDHSAALAWYDKALPLLAVQEEPSELVVPRREGETLVSMAVSYWSEGEKQRAVELTEAGAALLETGVEAGVADRKTLAVPYGNLATMHKLLGNAVDAERFNKLSQDAAKSQSKAKQASTPVRRLQPATGAQKSRTTTTQKQAAPARQPAATSQTKTPSTTKRAIAGRSNRNTTR